MDIRYPKGPKFLDKQCLARSDFCWRSSLIRMYTAYHSVCIFWTHCFMVKRQMSCLMTKQTKWHVRPAKTQISLGICPVWSESLLCAQWVAEDPSSLHADSKDTDQAGLMSRLIWVVAGHTVILLVLSWGGSNHVVQILRYYINFSRCPICLAFSGGKEN